MASTIRARHTLDEITTASLSSNTAVKSSSASNYTATSDDALVQSADIEQDYNALTPVEEKDEAGEKLRMRQWRRMRMKVAVASVLVLCTGSILLDMVMRSGGGFNAAVHDFLGWMENNPLWGVFAYVVVYTVNIVLLIPGTPLTLGGAFVFSQALGIKW
eukprot:CAMPEP_0172496346 /NCGR_PEP_ID=MMETSP1066-20121228/85709_1 /TAXON_ID=671091 /ORGANISM="Coscinodiscus wailesii, Strain CCMP2513" /LENGTH=159 /DNA_ID=CAMNT_0013268603 /DNA_START=36 /DNA_END=512 /DNA_ORIENTATION=-